MKKIGAVMLFVLLFVGTAFAELNEGWGIGALGGYNYRASGVYNDGSAGLSLKMPSIPVYWGANVRIGEGFGLGLSADWHIYETSFIETDKIDLDFFIGPGLFGNFYFGNNFFLNAGIRVPVGVSFGAFKFLEIFVQGVPNVGLNVNPMKFFFGLGAEGGIRIWFN
jgi:hypothetical protein